MDMPPAGLIGTLYPVKEKTTSTSGSQSPIDNLYPEFQKAASPMEESQTSNGFAEATVPPSHAHRTLVLCFDGTGTTSYFLGSRLLFLNSETRRSIRWWCSFLPPIHFSACWNQFYFFQNSNIVNFFSMLKKDDPKEQLVYYQVRSLHLIPSQTVILKCLKRQGLGHIPSPRLQNRWWRNCTRHLIAW